MAIYRMHSGGSDQTTNMFAYISNSIHHSDLHKKKRKGSVKISATIYKTCVSFHFYLRRESSAGWGGSSIIEDWACQERVSLCSFKRAISNSENWSLLFNPSLWVLISYTIYNKYRQYIGTLLPIYRSWLWIYLFKIYRQYIGTGCTRSVVKILKVFTTNHNVYEPVATTIEEHDEWLQFCQREVRKYQTGLIAEQVSHQR